MPKIGFFCTKTCSFKASIKPSSFKFFIASLKDPTPGKSNLSAFCKSFGFLAMKFVAPIFSKALATEFKFPAL